MLPIHSIPDDDQIVELVLRHADPDYLEGLRTRYVATAEHFVQSAQAVLRFAAVLDKRHPLTDADVFGDQWDLEHVVRRFLALGDTTQPLAALSALRSISYEAADEVLVAGHPEASVDELVTTLAHARQSQGVPPYAPEQLATRMEELLAIPGVLRARRRAAACAEARSRGESWPQDPVIDYALLPLSRLLAVSSCPIYHGCDDPESAGEVEEVWHA